MAKKSLGLGLLNFHDSGIGKLHRQIQRLMEPTAGLRAAAGSFSQINAAFEGIQPSKSLGVTAEIAKLTEFSGGKQLRSLQDIQKGVTDTFKPTRRLVGPPLPSPPILMSEGVKLLSDTGWRRSVPVNPLPGSDILRAMRGLQEGVLGNTTYIFLRGFQDLEEASETAGRLHEQRLCEETLYANDMARMKRFTREYVGLSEDFWPEVAEVLYRSNWRDALRPIQYIRRVAWRYRRQRWHQENRPLIRTVAGTSEERIQLAMRLHGDQGDRQQRFELLHDSPFEGEELTLLYARQIVKVPRCAIPEFLGNGWDARRVERLRKRMERKLKEFKTGTGVGR